jgi:endonuclease/exonuclease/phosphatase family metal-dependent hydrolase
MIDRLEILWSALRRGVSRTRWSSRLLGHRPPPPHSDAPGLVLIQLDGLGERALRRALDEGQMPFLEHLLEREGHELRPVYTGLPSNTPGFQAEFFYGPTSTIPAFSFRDPILGRVVRMNDRAWVSGMERELGRKHPGLLQHGSAWSGIYNGGATETHFCISPAVAEPPPSVRGRLRIVGIVLWHGWSLIRVAGNLFFTTALALRDWLRGRIDRGELAYELRWVPFRVLVGAAIREVVTAGASIDAERGLPVIHVNFTGFDELSHRRGPTARSARMALRGIDRAVRRVTLAAHRSKGRDYQIWIYSDHGHETVAPFERRRGATLSQVVERVYRMVRDIVGARGAPPPSLAFPPLPGEVRSQALAEGMPAWLRGGSAPKMVGSLRFGEKPGGSGDLPEGERNGGEASDHDAGSGAIEVVYQGPLGFVYLPVRHDRAFLAWLAEVLAAEGGIPWVLLPEGVASVLAFSADGRFFRLPEEAAAVLGADHPHLAETAVDLVRQVRHRSAGDLTLLGWDRGAPLSFEVERGTHGGPGPAETSAFVLFPPEVRAFTRIPERLRPRDLRRMALHVLDRREEHEKRVRVLSPLRTAEEIRENGKAGSVPLRLMTYNVHGCRGMDGKFAPQRIARVIARERPDVVCLQELDQERTRSGGVDQVKVIAERLQADYRFHAVAEVDDGAFGNAILSSHELRVVKAGALPSAARVKDVLNLENRGVLWVTLRLDGGDIQILNTHLSILDRERRIQTEALLGPDWLAHPDCRDPVILCGDFNASPDSHAVRRLEARLHNVLGPERKERSLRTWSGRMPLRRIDHVLVSGEIEPAGAHVPRNRLSRVASDHLPLIVDLVCRLNRPDPAPAGTASESR